MARYFKQRHSGFDYTGFYKEEGGKIYSWAQKDSLKPDWEIDTDPDPARDFYFEGTEAQFVAKITEDDRRQQKKIGDSRF